MDNNVNSNGIKIEIDNLSFCSTCNLWLYFNGVSSDKKLNFKVPEYLFEMEHCSLCHRIWDGNAQCPC